VLRLGRLHVVAEVARIHRHVAPAEDLQALVGDGLGDDLLHQPEPFRVARHEQVADAVFALLRQPDAELGAFGREEAVRDLDQDAAAVAGLRIRPDRAAVVEVQEDLEALRDDLMGPAVLHVGDEADAAGILLARRIVQALGRRQGRVAHDHGLVRPGPLRFGGRTGRGFDVQALVRHVAHARSLHPFEHVIRVH
jgi:hypothetical protein